MKRTDADRRKRQAARMASVLKILKRLERNPATLADLKQEAGNVSERTVFRYLDVLREAGTIIESFRKDDVHYYKVRTTDEN